MNKAIFIVEAGFVFLCDDYTRADGAWVLSGASVIRVWGTTKGIGEIALNGPTKNTVLDPCGSPSIPVGKVIAILPCTY